MMTLRAKIESLIETSETEYVFKFENQHFVCRKKFGKMYENGNYFGIALKLSEFISVIITKIRYNTELIKKIKNFKTKNNKK